MKNLKRMLLLVLILIGSNVIEAYSKIVIKIVIARHRDCEGWGFCEWSASGDVGPVLARQAIATVDVNSDNRLVLTFSKKSMLPETFTQYFSKDNFLCEDDFPVPSAILKSLNLTKPYTIKAGSYPVVINGDLITVEF